MPGFGDYIFIFVLALILFGPKKMPELARQLGKLMGEFRRASNEFKMQMEEEMRVSERAEQEKKVAALEAAAPPPVFSDETTAALPAETEIAAETPERLEIATSGELAMHPPETGLPVAQSSVTEMLEIEVPVTAEATTTETAAPASTSSDAVNALVDSVPAASESTLEGQTTHG